MEVLETPLIREVADTAPNTPRKGESWRLYDELSSLGNHYSLALPLDAQALKRELNAFEPDWVQYNPYKPEVARQGLSVTSLDGEMGGKPDLYSLKEYFKRENQLYHEKDFRVLTRVYSGMASIHPLIDYFAPDIGRTHFLRFGAGGYFPPHRDGSAVKEIDAFRILVPVDPIGEEDFQFILDGQPLKLKAGHVYFLNTLMAHSVFSFRGKQTILVCNILLNRNTVLKVKKLAY